MAHTIGDLFEFNFEYFEDDGCLRFDNSWLLTDLDAASKAGGEVEGILMDVKSGTLKIGHGLFAVSAVAPRPVMKARSPYFLTFGDWTLDTCIAQTSDAARKQTYGALFEYKRCFENPDFDEANHVWFTKAKLLVKFDDDFDVGTVVDWIAVDVHAGAIYVPSASLRSRRFVLSDVKCIG